MVSDDLRAFKEIPEVLLTEQALPVLMCEREWQYDIHHA